VDAIINIDDSIGPTHGTQPAANVMPSNNAPINPTGLLLMLILFSMLKGAIFKSPVMVKPKNTITAPPMTLR
jgi:hypothetical protein